MSDNFQQLPGHGVPLPEIERELKASMLDGIRGHFSRAFRGPADVQEVGKAAYNMFLSDNGLFSMRADYMNRVETAVTQMCVGLFNAPPGASGTFTSGGSESIFSALHAMREWARVNLPAIRDPEIVAPYSAHPSFSKGCHYLGIKLIRTPLGADFRASVENMEGAISANTIGLVGSAPCWPYGLYDPIGKLSDLAMQRRIWLHVDACVGGYLAPFLERLGIALPEWDFRLAGVMSISADLHKFGYCPKPASTILWRSDELKRYHYVHPHDWPGGVYSMSGFAGSRSAGPIFAAWAVMQYLGIDGYVRLARKLLETKARLVNGINSIDGLQAWENDLLPIAFGAKGVDLGAVKAELSRLGWILVAAAEPPLINLPVDAATGDDVVNTFLRDLRMVTSQIRDGKGQIQERLSY